MTGECLWLERLEELIDRGSKGAPTFPLLVAFPYSEGVQIPKTVDECRQLARRLAYSVITGFVEHDRGGVNKAVDCFYEVFLQLFPEAGPLRARRAAELYVDACFKQDEIEDVPSGTKAEMSEDPRWADVRSILLEFAKILDIPKDYAEQSTNFFRYHGARDSRYVNYCLEADRIFTTRIVGNSYWSNVLGPLFLICTHAHDKHDPNGLEACLQFAEKYFEILLVARMHSSLKTIAATA